MVDLTPTQIIRALNLDQQSEMKESRIQIVDTKILCKVLY